MQQFFLLILLVLLTYSCGNTNQSQETTDMEHMIETLSKGTMGSPMLPGQNGEHEILITNQEDFSTLWQQMHQGMGNGEEIVPEIDFERYMVVGVVMGEMPSSGYSIRIDDIEQQEEHLNVNVLRTEPGPTCINLTVMTYPHHIIKVPATEQPFNFSYTTIVEECD